MNPFKAIGRGAKAVVTAPVKAVRTTTRMLRARNEAADVWALAEEAEANPRLYRDAAWWKRLLTQVGELLAVLPLAPEIREMTFLKNVLANYKTTLAGVAAILASLTAVANGTPIDDPAVLTGFITGLGLIVGKDASKTGVAVKSSEPPAK